MLSEEEIIKGCLKEDKTAQKALYDKYSHRMFGICLRYMKTNDEAEDALQDGFIKVYSNISQFNHNGSFEGWIRRIIINSAINYHYYKIKHRHQSDYLEIEDKTNDTIVSNDQLSLEDLLLLIHSLPDGYKQVFNLFEIDGYSHKEIANMLGITISTSKSQLLKSKIMLRSKISRLKK